MSHLIQLPRNLAAIVDDEDYDFIASMKWSVSRSDQISERWYASRSRSSVTTYMHRLIAGAQQGVQVDHMNGDSLDNRRANLRFASQSQNNANARFKRGVSGLRGVYLERGTFRAQVNEHGRTVHIGNFTTATEAAFARDRAARNLYGEFATLNFPCLSGPEGRS